MKLRSITCFINLPWKRTPSRLRWRFCGGSPPGLRIGRVRCPDRPPGDLALCRLAPALAHRRLPCAWCASWKPRPGASGFEYLSLGPALPGDLPAFDLIPEMLAATQSVFLTGLMTLDGGGVSLPAVRRCAAIIAQVSGSVAGWFHKPALRRPGERPGRHALLPRCLPQRGAARLCPGNRGRRPGGGSLPVGRWRIPGSSACSAGRVSRRRTPGGWRKPPRPWSEKPGFRFGGIDFSPAPFPDDAISLGAAIEWLGVPQLGSARFAGLRRPAGRSDRPGAFPQSWLQRVDAPRAGRFPPGAARR